MHYKRGRLAGIVGLALAIFTASGASADAVRAGGTGGATGMLKYLAATVPKGRGFQVEAAFENGRYFYGKTRDVVTSAKPNVAVEKFVAFLNSSAGRRALRESGNLPVGE